jgi:putative pre-16S rRNA nuclease
MRILAVDFGEKRIGLATCDATGQVVAARRTLTRGSDEKAVQEIAQFCREEDVEAVVLGVPRSPEGVESRMAGRIRSFGGKLSRALAVPVAYHEETLTSWQARLDDPTGTKEAIDRGAAAILLADYLSAHRERESR